VWCSDVLYRWPAAVTLPTTGPGLSIAPKAVSDTSGNLLVSAATLAVSGSGNDFWFARKLAGQNWTNAQIALSVTPTSFPVNIAPETNATGASVLGAGFGGNTGIRFIGADGQLGATLTRPISPSLGQFPDLTVLANGAAVYSTVEARSGTDATLTPRIYQVNSTGGVSSAAPRAAAKSNSSHFFSLSTLNGYLTYFTDSVPTSATPGILGSVSAAGNPTRLC
jgi:hypothetical protein